MTRILLSVPHMGGSEAYYVQEAFDTNWISTTGPNLERFEAEFEARINAPVVALASGTAALHLGLRLLNVGPGDEVFVSALTFVAAANVVRYQGATPVFVDSESRTWNMDPGLLETALERRAEENRLPKAIIVVHLFGQSADMDPILEISGRHDIPVIEDAAEAVGTLYKGRPVGTLGALGAYSFNGNKIITTSSGGILTSPHHDWVKRARFWSTQARDSAVWYEHSQMGYNYRMSNIVAGIGRGQLEVLELRIRQRREIAFRYKDAFEDLRGIAFMPQAPYGLHTNWLSCFLIDEDRFGASRDEVIEALDAANIESRPVWKPMHLQPLYADCECFGGEVAEDLFRRGICLPSSSSLTPDEQLYVINEVRHVAGASALPSLDRVAAD